MVFFWFIGLVILVGLFVFVFVYNDEDYERFEQERDYLLVGIMWKFDYCLREFKDGDYLMVRYNNMFID